ncbi:hypothetical protein N2152v2_002095 [Parachlorella kessleri]
MAAVELRWPATTGPSGVTESTACPPSTSASPSWSEEKRFSQRQRATFAPVASLTQGVVTAATGAGVTMVLRRAMANTPANLGQAAGKDVAAPSAAPAPPAAAPPPPPPQPDQKPAHDVVAGAMARAASQSTIHPLDTMKVRMQTGRVTRTGATSSKPSLPPRAPKAAPLGGLSELKGLYKGVVGAATGAGVIIGTYFAFYSTTKRFLRSNTQLNEGATAFVAGAAAALGSSVVKVPLAVCIRSVQAGIYKNVVHAAKEITKAAGVRGLFTGFLPTVLEDVPDMAVKFAAYETMRAVHRRMAGDRPAHTLEDLIMGGVAGAAAAAATTPLDVVKTIMMCNASSKPTIVSAARGILAEGRGLRPFFRGVGPRALSNGLNSAIFFCFFEAIRQVLIKQQQEKAAQLLREETLGAARQLRPHVQQRQLKGTLLFSREEGAATSQKQQQQLEQQALVSSSRPAGSPAACLSLALPLPGWGR